MTRSLPTRIAAACLPALVLVSCAGSTSALPAKDEVARYDAVGAAVAAALQPSGHTWTAATSQRGVRADGSTCLYSTGSGWKPSPAVADGFILDDPGFVAARGALDQALTTPTARFCGSTPTAVSASPGPGWTPPRARTQPSVCPEPTAAALRTTRNPRVRQKPPSGGRFMPNRAVPVWVRAPTARAARPTVPIPG